MFPVFECLVYTVDVLVWIHDYHLFLLPQMLRERLPNATIGFFLHVPFPSSEVFRMLFAREPLLQGILGADLIGFQVNWIAYSAFPLFLSSLFYSSFLTPEHSSKLSPGSWESKMSRIGAPSSSKIAFLRFRSFLLGSTFCLFVPSETLPKSKIWFVH